MKETDDVSRLRYRERDGDRIIYIYAAYKRMPTLLLLVRLGRTCQHADSFCVCAYMARAGTHRLHQVAFYLDVTIDELISLANSNAYIHIQ